jgi:hypothetical protein
MPPSSKHVYKRFRFPHGKAIEALAVEDFSDVTKYV